ncbi:DUF6436 domain-containing protein [Pseudoalteromonas shioyasakiensis]|uniref:DUF6436 domain-containing protein n=1 Tax=Pseudoalteromonas shioyasakiensis TaxID=1190813 RepID=UPI0021193119|nr:DUF6436 domain-containing protein [Pseudoalteromonas shioyasakiensis]MCQ8879488.1 DUF6436 domain-containing protein [Pseudoalteromonas shioyasakiensis]
MQTSHKAKYTHYMVFAVWLVFTLIAGVSFIQSRLVAFDPTDKLLYANGESLINDISALPQLSEEHINNVLIHFTSEGCECAQYSDRHKKDITDAAKEDGFTVLNIHLPKGTQSIIPSTPATLIVGQSSELLYFGPYSTGLACSESNGFVELVLNNYRNGFKSDLIVGDTTGCYCQL